MKTEHLFICIVAASLSLVGCASKEGEPLTPASREMESSPEATPAGEKNEVIEPQQCVSTEECGPGYVCGFDPSISHVVRHCMAE
jgi:hypothetical protein